MLGTESGTEAGVLVALIALAGGVALKLLDRFLPARARPRRPQRVSADDLSAQLDGRMVRWMDHIESELDECRTLHKECEDRDLKRAQEVAVLQIEVGALKRLGNPES